VKPEKHNQPVFTAFILDDKKCDDYNTQTFDYPVRLNCKNLCFCHYFRDVLFIRLLNFGFVAEMVK